MNIIDIANKKKKYDLTLLIIDLFSETSFPILFWIIMDKAPQINSWGMDKILNDNSRTPKSLTE